MKQTDKITLAELEVMAQNMYGSFVKAVVDIEKNLLVVDVEMHVDAEQFLLENGSKQADLWGINLHPARYATDGFVEFDSMVNIRPRQRNTSRYVEDAEVRARIVALVKNKVTT